MIVIDNLVKYYGSFLAVDQISFEVRKGEILGFLGPNGAGKTTTMKIITGYMPPSAGNVYVDGMSVTEHSLDIRKKIGYLPEHNALYPDMGIMEYLQFIMDAREIPKDKQSKQMQYAIEVCGLTDVLSKNIGELSKGYKQRVGLAQALIHNPDILILDEPTVGLDPNQIIEIRNLIKKIGEEKTVILSTHILPEVEVTCDRVVIINKGKIAAIGTTDDLQKTFKGNDKIEIILKDKIDESIKEKIQKIDGILNITSHNTEEDQSIIKIEVEKGKDPRYDIFQFIVQEKLPLLELKREQISLEDIFRELTVQENLNN